MNIALSKKKTGANVKNLLAPQPTLLSLENEQLSIMCAFFQAPIYHLG
jgi:hypothetical protein